MEEIQWLGHSGIKIKGRGKVLYIDPYNIHCHETADFIFITHPHERHFSIEDIKKISSEKTNIYATPECIEQLEWFPGWAVSVEPGEEYQAGDFKIRTVPAYNLTGESHPQTKGWVGYVIDFGDMRVYHTGDTDLIPEMSGIHKLDYAILPVSGENVMSPGEAAQAADILKPKITIPIHYNQSTDGIKDAEEFKNAYHGFVRILKKG